jgi:hypothetical protein
MKNSVAAILNPPLNDENIIAELKKVVQSFPKKTCPKAVKTLKPKIRKTPTIAVAIASSFFKRNGCFSRVTAIARIDAAAVNETALSVSGGISVRRNLTAGQFKPHKTPISKNVATFISRRFTLTGMSHHSF